MTFRLAPMSPPILALTAVLFVLPVAFLVLAAASFGIFLIRRRHLRQLRPWR